ncbi:TPA: sucrose-6-phosphate hydrolase [Klebsiella pneumoniae]|nr:sucrose-6-phosphate hydrolase [Klebsiella pneumoniae]
MSLPSRLPAILQAVMQGQPQALADSHYPQWHLAPVNGLLNDPNGFCQVAGRYHLFYQWNPLACDHTYKCWGHWSSADLLHWRHEPIALMPDEEYDRNGCYSGSAVEFEGALTLCYTGNVKFPDGGRTAWQCLATENADGTFRKLGTVLPLPEGYTGHVRDPKVWRQDGRWYMVLGAQDVQQRGKVLLFTASDLREWRLVGEIAGHDVNGLANAGYMWECPDLFPLADTHLLICCPQGLAREAQRFLNTYPAVWMAGRFDAERGIFDHGPLHELDSGFEFYAPQTMQADDGRRLLVGWMGVPDGDEMHQPTRAQGWIHQMTCVRELEWQAGTLYQRPLRELVALRGEAQGWCGQTLPLAPMELAFDLSPDSTLGLDFAGALQLTVNRDGLRLSRRGLQTAEMHHRYWRGEARRLRIFIDRSSVEIFINDGEGVMSSRFFPGYPGQLIFSGATPVAFCRWLLRLSPSRDRLAGFTQGLAQAGITLRPEWVINGNYHPSSGYEMFAALCARLGRPPKALFTAACGLLEGVLRYMSQHHLLDSNIHLASFDDHYLYDSLSLRIDTVQQDNRQLAWHCYDLLSQLIDGQAPEPLQRYLPATLQIRHP